MSVLSCLKRPSTIYLCACGVYQFTGWFEDSHTDRQEERSILKNKVVSKCEYFYIILIIFLRTYQNRKEEKIFGWSSFRKKPTWRTKNKKHYIYDGNLKPVVKFLTILSSSNQLQQVLSQCSTFFRFMLYSSELSQGQILSNPKKLEV